MWKLQKGTGKQLQKLSVIRVKFRLIYFTPLSSNNLPNLIEFRPIKFPTWKWTVILTQLKFFRCPAHRFWLIMAHFTRSRAYIVLLGIETLPLIILGDIRPRKLDFLHMDFPMHRAKTSLLKFLNYHRYATKCYWPCIDRKLSLPILDAPSGRFSISIFLSHFKSQMTQKSEDYVSGNPDLDNPSLTLNSGLPPTSRFRHLG
jgi:hypothetical protein